MLKIVTALVADDEDIEEKRLREVLDAFVESYGGTPGETRYRLDNLIKYGKNDLQDVPPSELVKKDRG